MSAEVSRELIDRVFYATKDPTVTLFGGPAPAATTLLHRVCGNDEARFEEAVRVVELFIAEALRQAKQRAIA